MILYTSYAKQECFFEKTEYYALFGHDDVILRDITLLECRDACLEDDNCNSFEYNYQSDSCFMSEDTKDSFDCTSLFGHHEATDYFQKYCDDLPEDYEEMMEPEKYRCPIGEVHCNDFSIENCIPDRFVLTILKCKFCLLRYCCNIYYIPTTNVMYAFPLCKCRCVI